MKHHLIPIALVFTIIATTLTASQDKDPASPFKKGQPSSDGFQATQLADPAFEASIQCFLEREGLLDIQTDHPYAKPDIDYPAYCLNNKKAKHAYRKSLRLDQIRAAVLKHDLELKHFNRYLTCAGSPKTSEPILP